MDPKVLFVVLRKFTGKLSRQVDRTVSAIRVNGWKIRIFLILTIRPLWAAPLELSR